MGLFVNSNLSCDQHCLCIVRELPQLVNFILRNFETRWHCFSGKLYEFYVLPLRDYCFVFSSIVEAQKVFTKHICGQGSSHLSCFDIIKEFFFETWKEEGLGLIYCYFQSSSMVLYLEHFGFFFFFIFFFFSVHGNSWKPTLNSWNSYTCRHIYFNRVAKIWRNLPDSVVMTFNYKDFDYQLGSEEVAKVVKSSWVCLSIPDYLGFWISCMCFQLLRICFVYV